MPSLQFGPWTRGIVNSSRDYTLPKSDAPGAQRTIAVLDALNVDFTDKGTAVTRRGYSQTVAVDNGHSLKTLGGKTLMGVGTELRVITAMSPLATTTLRTGLDGAAISYDERGGEVWWSNGVDSGRCNADNTDHPWVPPAPGNLSAVFAGAGTLPAGTYRVAITHAMSDGEESVASDIEEITLASAGAITLTLPAATAGTDAFNVYCTVANGKVLQKYSTVAAATASVSITAAPQGRQLADRAFLKPLPPGTAICFHGGRLLSLSGEVLYYSRPYDYGVYDPAQDYLILGTAGSIIASVESGVFVAADRTWFYSGTDIASAEPTELLDYGAVAGTEFNPPLQTNPTAGWFSHKGVVIGSNDGTIVLQQRAKGFIAPTADSGASWVRQRDGQVHVVVSLDSTAAYDGKVSDDFATALARYNNDSTTVCMELTGGATSRYSNWYFNSYATFDGEDYGMDSAGLRLLDGTDDEGTEIEAVVDLGLIGYDTPQIKSPDSVYVRGKSSDILVVDIALPTGDIYNYPAHRYSESMAVMRHAPMKGLLNQRQQGFNTIVRNQDGGSFELAGVEVTTIESKRKI